MNVFSSIIMLFYMALNPYSSELSDAIQFIASHSNVTFDILLFSVTGVILF
jgi:UDP-galactose transporter B1